MRKLLFLLLLAAGGYYGYTYTRHLREPLPEEIAWRGVARDQRGAVTSVEVVTVVGKCWRAEISTPGKQRTLVTVSDGASTASSISKATAAQLDQLDPRRPMRSLLRIIKHASPKATERLSGRDYLHFTVTEEGKTIDLWADLQTRFPFRVRTAAGPGAQFFEVTYTALPIEAIRKTPDLFSLTALKPLLASFAVSK